MKKEERGKKLNELLNKIEQLHPLNHEHPYFKKSYDEAKRILKEFYGDHPYVVEFENIQFSDLIFRMGDRIYPSDRKFYEDGLNKAENIITRFIELEEQYSQKRREES